MILIVSHKQDFTTDYIVNKLNKKGIEYLRFNTDDILEKHRITIKYQHGILKVSIDNCDQFDSVWFRRTKNPQPQFDTEIDTTAFQKDYTEFLKCFWKILKVKNWISNPEKIQIAENKLFQLKLATEIGFKIPDTIISNQNEAIRKFSFDYENVIIKPFFTSRISVDNEEKLVFTNVFKSDLLTDEEVAFPIFFQHKIEKECELRVTVVGDKVFPAKVQSQNFETTKIDWRRDRLKFEKVEIPLCVENQCVKIVKSLGLKFGAIDLIKQQNGEFIFLEINPNGQWVWIESDTGLKISDEIIKMLIN